MSREKQIEEMAKVIDEFTETLSARDIHKAEFSEQFAEALYTEGYRKQEWISVDERLPEYRELVLVSSMDLLTKKHGWFYLARYTNTMSNGVSFDEKRWVGEACGLFGRVTHWMPLPEAPKMKGGE